VKTKTIPSSWLHRDGRRFDSGPYTSGALEAKLRLDELDVPKERLIDLTSGHNGGIYNGPQFSRNWVDSPEHGVPFLGSSSMLMADLSNVPLLRRKDAESGKLAYLRIRPGTTLISCSGTIGRMVYVRPDMDGMWTSQHIMKVAPDPQRVPSGYVYAFLSGKFGVPIVASGTYGAIIQHIDPQHIADLPIPRFGQAIECQAHNLVEEAARLRADASKMRQRLIESTESELEWDRRPLYAGIGLAPASSLQRRLDAFHHSAPIISARGSLARGDSARLGAVAQEVYEPNRGPRRKVDDPAYGVPFLSSSEVFRLDPVGEYLISRARTPQLDRSLVSERDVLLPRSGQVGGIIGRAVLPLPTYHGQAASEHLVRVRCESPADAYFLWAILATEPGYYAAIGTSFGSSIPSLDGSLLADLRVPWWRGQRRADIVSQVDSLNTALTRAVYAEREAVTLVESSISEAN
jgi:type I restriction enzyme, S subunit